MADHSDSLDPVDALDHCLGTLIVHSGNIVECTEDECVDVDRLRHTFVIDCFDLAGGCICLDLVAGRRLKAS